MSKNIKSIISDESECVEMLRTVLKREKDLNCPLDDEFLLRFIRGKKFNVDSAFESVKSYYQMREKFPEMVSKLYPSALKGQFDKNIYHILPNEDKKGPRVMLFKTRHWDVNEFSLDDILSGCYLITEEMISHEDGQLNGVVIICDHGGITFSQIRKIAGQVTIKQTKKLIGFYQGAFPAKFKGVHIVNHPRIFDMIFMLSRPFMSDKLKRRIHEHGYNSKKLHAFFNPDILPESLGGSVSEDECSDSEYMKRFYERDEYYKEMVKYGYTTKNNEKA